MILLRLHPGEPIQNFPEVALDPCERQRGGACSFNPLLDPIQLASKRDKLFLQPRPKAEHEGLNLLTLLQGGPGDIPLQFLPSRRELVGHVLLAKMEEEARGEVGLHLPEVVALLLYVALDQATYDLLHTFGSPDQKGFDQLAGRFGFHRHQRLFGLALEFIQTHHGRRAPGGSALAFARFDRRPERRGGQLLDVMIPPRFEIAGDPAADLIDPGGEQVGDQSGRLLPQGCADKGAKKRP